MWRGPPAIKCAKKLRKCALTSDRSPIISTRKPLSRARQWILLRAINISGQSWTIILTLSATQIIYKKKKKKLFLPSLSSAGFSTWTSGEKTHSKILEVHQSSPADLFNKKDSHLWQSEFQLLPSGSQLRLHKIKSNRYKHSFVPSAISLLNSRREQSRTWLINSLIFFLGFTVFNETVLNRNSCLPW